MKKWTMPEWMEKYIKTVLIFNKEKIEEMMNDKEGYAKSHSKALRIRFLAGGIHALEVLKREGVI